MITYAALVVCMCVVSVLTSFATCAIFKWVYTWHGDVVVSMKWKQRPLCPQCGLDLNTKPLVQLAEIGVEK